MHKMHPKCINSVDHVIADLMGRADLPLQRIAARSFAVDWIRNRPPLERQAERS